MLDRSLLFKGKARNHGLNIQSHSKKVLGTNPHCSLTFRTVIDESNKSLIPLTPGGLEGGRPPAPYAAAAGGASAWLWSGCSLGLAVIVNVIVNFISQDKTYAAVSTMDNL